METNSALSLEKALAKTQADADAVIKAVAAVHDSQTPAGRGPSWESPRDAPVHHCRRAGDRRTEAAIRQRERWGALAPQPASNVSRGEESLERSTRSGKRERPRPGAIIASDQALRSRLNHIPLLVDPRPTRAWDAR